MGIKSFSIKGILILCLLAGSTTFQHASFCFAREPIRSVTGSVAKVSDGNTIQVKTRKRTLLKVRLYGIDAPEIKKINRSTGHIIKPGQPFGNEAKSYLSSMILGKTVHLDVMNVDRNRIMESLVWLNGKNVNLEMLKAGMAEVYLEYLRDRQYRDQFIRAEMEPMRKQIGIWSLGDKYERPSDFRRRLRVRGN